MQDYAEELLVPPVPLVGLISDAGFNGKLAETLKQCSSSRPASAAAGGVELNYMPYSLAHKFPRKERAHGQDYDSYVPAGILRSNWLKKHAHHVPSLMVLAWPFSVRATNDEWTRLEGPLVTAVLSLREYARGRGQDVHVVLVNDGGLPQGRNAMGDDYGDVLSDRITALRRKSGLDGNAVTFITDADVNNDRSPLLQSLDIALTEKVLAYYQANCRRLKSVLQSRVKQPAQQGLRVRLLFKVAHYQEYRNRNAKALKYYCLAANALQAWAPSCPPHLLNEAKAVSDLINFKLMHGFLQHGLEPVQTHTGMSIPGAQAAMMLFNAHMRTWEAHVSPEDKARPWQLWAWMSRQYVVAAELLQLNLPRPTAETKASYVPAHYYHTAGIYAGKRRKAAEAAGILPSVQVQWGGAEAGTGAAAITVTGVEEAKARHANPSAVQTATVAAAQAEVSKYAVAEARFVGQQPLVAPLGSQQPLPPAQAAPVLHAAELVKESKIEHYDLVTQLLEKAQAISLIDGGSGTVARGLSGSSSAANAASNPSAASPSKDGMSSQDRAALLFYSYGSNFTFEVAPDCSRGRLWRQALLASEAFSIGRIDAAARLLLPVAERYRCEKAWPLLAKVLQSIRHCAAVLGDRALLAASTVELLETAQHTTVATPTETLHAQLQGLLLSGKAEAGQALVTVPMPAPSTLTVDVDDAQPSFVRAPGPARATASLRKPNAPLLSAVVAFSSRCAQRGRRVRVRLILTSALPRPMLAEQVHVTFAHAHGDFPLRVEGQGSDSARPVMSGMRQLASASPFDVIIKHGAAPSGSSLDDGVLVLPHGSQQAQGGTSLLTLPLAIPARGSVAVEYDVELPGLGYGSDDGPASSSTATAKGSISPAVQAATALLEPTEAEASAVQAAALGGTASGATSGTAAGGSPVADSASRWDHACTDPVTMFTALNAGPSAISRPDLQPVTSAWDPRSETILPQNIVVTWAGRESEADKPGSAVRFDLLPRPFGTGSTAPRHAAGVELRPVAPGLGLKAVDSFLTCLAQHRVPTVATLADSMPAPVAHMVRTGVGLGSARGQACRFRPGSGGVGFADGDIPAEPSTAVAVADADTTAAAAAAGAAFLAAPGSGIAAAAPAASLSADGGGAGGPGPAGPPAFLSHETDGAACGKPLPYHPMLLVLAPDAHITISTGSGWTSASTGAGSSASGSSTATAAAVVGIPSPVQFTVSCGRRGVTGGVLKLSAASATIRVSSRRGSLAVGAGAVGMADVSLAGSLTSALDSAAAGSTLPKAASSSSTGPENLPVSLLVHPEMLVLLGDGRQVKASTTGGHVTAGLVRISGGAGKTAVPVVGIALPALPAGVAFSFTAHILVEGPAASGGNGAASGASVEASMAACATVALQCEAHVAEEDGAASSASSASGAVPDWLSTLATAPTLHRTLASSFLMPAYPALAVAANVLPDPCAPLMDLGPLLLPLHGPQRPLQYVPQAFDAATGVGGALPAAPGAWNAAGDGAAFSLLPCQGVPVCGHVRVGSRFTLQLAVKCNPVAPVRLSGLELGRPGGQTDGLKVETSREELLRLCGLAKPAVPSGLAAGGLAAAVAKALASSAPSLVIQPGGQFTVPVAVHASSPGLASPGTVNLQWTSAAAGSGPAVQLSAPLAPVAVHDPAVRCTVTYPDNPRVGDKCTMALQLTNASAHFHAIEVNAVPPAALPPTGLAQGSGVGSSALGAPGTPARAGGPPPSAGVPRPLSSGAPAAPGQGPFSPGPAGGPGAVGGLGSPASGPQRPGALVAAAGSLPVPAMELQGYSRFIVELLPGASKTVTFTLLPHVSGYVALPHVTLRAVTGNKMPAPAGAAAAARKVSAGGDVLLALCSSGGPGAPGVTVTGRRGSVSGRPGSRRGSAVVPLVGMQAGQGGLPVVPAPGVPLPLTVYVN